MTRTITIGFTPDPDDAFAFYALVHGRVATPGWTPQVRTASISDLNAAAGSGRLDVAAVSSAYYPFLAKRYAVLRSGASVGRGYGPVLAVASRSREQGALSRVAIPGESTTGAALLRLFDLPTTTVVRPHHRIAEEIARGSIDGGVLIHEELLEYGEQKLRKRRCLGREWADRTALPLPVGLNVVRRGLPQALARSVATAVQDSIAFALNHREEASLWARQFGRGPSAEYGDRFIEMFANEDTVHFGKDCEAGLECLLGKLYRAGLTPSTPTIDFVEPQRAGSRAPLSPVTSTSLTGVHP